MQAIDPNTLAAIGGQKGNEAAKSFADTMLQLYRTKKEAALLDVQTEAARIKNEMTKATQQETVDAEKAALVAQKQESEEFVSSDAKSARAMQKKAATGEALKSLKEYENFFNTFDEKSKIETVQLANTKALETQKAYQIAISNLPAVANSPIKFSDWKSQNTDIVERMVADPQLAKLMSKPALTAADTRMIQSKQEQIIGQTPEWAEFYMKTMLQHKLDMEKIKAEASAKPSSATVKWEATSGEQLKADMTGEIGIDTAPAQVAVDAYVGWATAIKNEEVPPVPNERLTAMLKNMAKTGTKTFGKNDTNYIAAQAGSAMDAYKIFLKSGGRESAAPFLAPMYDLDIKQAEDVYKQWVALAKSTGRNPTLDDLWYIANLASVDPKNKHYFVD